MAPTLPRFAELPAPANWRMVEFISDLHLQASEPATFEAWRRYMAATPADAVFILGDLFEVWVGDDVLALPGFRGRLRRRLRATAQRARCSSCTATATFWRARPHGCCRHHAAA
jgi:UDP-2,3-diacylglucosamine hydrolase